MLAPDKLLDAQRYRDAWVQGSRTPRDTPVQVTAEATEAKMTQELNFDVYRDLWMRTLSGTEAQPSSQAVDAKIPDRTTSPTPGTHRSKVARMTLDQDSKAAGGPEGFTSLQTVQQQQHYRDAWTVGCEAAELQMGPNIHCTSEVPAPKVLDMDRWREEWAQTLALTDVLVAPVSEASVQELEVATHAAAPGKVAPLSAAPPCTCCSDLAFAPESVLLSRQHYQDLWTQGCEDAALKISEPPTTEPQQFDMKIWRDDWIQTLMDFEFEDKAPSLPKEDFGAVGEADEAVTDRGSENPDAFPSKLEEAPCYGLPLFENGKSADAGLFGTSPTSPLFF